MNTRALATLWLVALISVAGARVAARADVTSYTVRVGGNDTVLTSVTATRGKGSVIFDAALLIRVKLLHFRAGSTANVASTVGGGAPAAHARATLLTAASRRLAEMKRFGALPADLPADAPIDPYATDQAYWRAFWRRPSAH